MKPKRLPQTCRWAVPTLDLPWPTWLDAWAWPWSCRTEDGDAKIVLSTTVCEDCPRWEFRGDLPIPFTGALRGRRCRTS